jgi:hypothetical protein
VDDQSWTATQTQMTAIRAALNALSIGVIANEILIAQNNTLSSGIPTNAFAQRETGLRLFYEDLTTRKKYQITIPCPDLDLVAQSGTDEVDMGLSVVSALVSALELFMVSPEGNSVNFYRGTIVGRRN